MNNCSRTTRAPGDHSLRRSPSNWNSNLTQFSKTQMSMSQGLGSAFRTKTGIHTLYHVYLQSCIIMSIILLISTKCHTILISDVFIYHKHHSYHTYAMACNGQTWRTSPSQLLQPPCRGSSPGKILEKPLSWLWTPVPRPTTGPAEMSMPIQPVIPCWKTSPSSEHGKHGEMSRHLGKQPSVISGSCGSCSV